jgi:hypothetical protein
MDASVPMNNFQITFRGQHDEAEQELIRMAKATGLTVTSGPPLLNSADPNTTATHIVIAATLLKSIVDLVHTWLNQQPRSLDSIRPGIYIRIGNMCSKEDLTKILKTHVEFGIRDVDLGLNDAAQAKVPEPSNPFAPPSGIVSAIPGSIEPKKGN